MSMKRMIPLTALIFSLAVPAFGAEIDKPIAKPIHERYSSPDVQEVPDFRRHMTPLLSKLGCNGRACHGSFQGRGGFRLSLFGHDFEMDHKALTKGEEPRVDLKNPGESLIIQKPTDEDIHEGGQRYKLGSWEHHVFRRWIEGGANNVPKDVVDFVRLDITPKEILVKKKGQKNQLKVVAVWSDGTQEDVTPLCRYKSNNSTNANISDTGLVTSGEPGDTHVVVFYDTGVVPIPVIQPVSQLAGANYPQVETPTKIDELVVQKLKKLGIVPSDLANDAEFLRRVSLDLSGSLPTPQEVEKFLAENSSDKRSKKIDELLNSPAYAAWWTTKLCDFTGNNDDQLNNVVPSRNHPASRDWYDWIHKRVAENTSYDELVAGIVVANSRNPGESFNEFSENMSKLYHKDSNSSFAEDRETMPYYWARRNFRTPEERVIGFAYTFLGIRIQCAQCHKHPFDQWTQNDFKQFTPFFTSTRSGRNPATRKEYDALIAKLELDDGLRGGQLRREIGKALQNGKTVPFQEVYTINPKNRQNGNFNKKRLLKNLKRLKKQIVDVKEQIQKLKDDGKDEQAKKVQKGRLATLNKQLKRATAAAKRNKAPAAGGVAKLLGGEEVNLAKVDDPRKPLMDWLRNENNQFFARSFVNRVWASYFNVGIVEPPDNLSLANPPSNKPLLDYLTQGFIDNGYDMKWLHRTIANSRTYQLSWMPNKTNIKDEVNFSHAIPRRLPAEVAYDAIQQATASDEKILAMHQDVTERAISIPGSGRRNRRNQNATYALTVFGRSIRESNCDCDRSSEASLLQTVYLQNDRDVFAMIDRRQEGWLGQVASELGLPLNSGAQSAQQSRFRKAAKSRQAKAKAQQVAAAKKRLSELQKRTKRARKQGNQKQLNALHAQIKNIKKRLANIGEAKPAAKQDEPEDKKTAPMDPDAVVRQAYLRTLSRYPSDEELSRSRKYLSESEDTVNGIRGLLWALLNTKEFIVNH
ncbi:MAG: DUF1549 domain-containing protein [Planctomycetes bacterium]|nr:DUF1549 domain-containing protein [Planctomycetota bacterium]